MCSRATLSCSSVGLRAKAHMNSSSTFSESRRLSLASSSARPPARRRARRKRVARIARALGFVGHVEYRHVYSQTGGAQYGQGTTAAEDLLTVYAEAFDRDADPDDFSLDAILAHERGHQLLAR